MSKTKTVTKITEIVTKVAPELKFVAAYNAEDPQLTGSMRLYENRCFVYVLTLQLKDWEACLYVGETRFQYGRFLRHKANLVFDRIYLYECEEGALRFCETAVIRCLTPLLNKNNNPMYFRFNRIMSMDNKKMNNRKEIVNCLELWYEYCNSGLYGFALPTAIYRLLRDAARNRKVTVSEELTTLLEAYYAKNITNELMRTEPEDIKTNLVTTAEYGEIYGKSQEQIKQYLHQERRLLGKKLGRDWVIIDDERFPEDRRKKDTTS